MNALTSSAAQTLCEPMALNTSDLNVSLGPLKNMAPDDYAQFHQNGLEPFWQLPQWWQLANTHLFNSQLELIQVTSAQGDLLAAFPIRQNGGLLSAPEHPHLTVGDSYWMPGLSATDIDTIITATLSSLQAWGWQLGNAPDTSASRLCENAAHWQWRQTRESAWFDTTDSVPIPGKLRRNLQRHWRLLETDAELHYTIADAKDESDIHTALDQFLELEASGWKGESGTAIQTDAVLKSFYHGLKTLKEPAINFEIHQLYRNGECIAAQLALRCNNSRYLLKIAYDETYAERSPGSLLLWKTLEHSVEQNLEHLSLVSAPAWAERWKPNVFPVWHVVRFSNDLQGAMREKASTLRNGMMNQLRETRNRMRS